MESINECDALLNIINDIIINKNINIQTDNINQIKLNYSSKIPYNTSNEYIIINLINLIEYSNNQINLNEFQISLLIDRLNELLILINNNEKQIIEQNTYQYIYQFIQYLHSIKQYGTNLNNIQLPPPIDYNYYPTNETQSQVQLIFDSNENQISMKNKNCYKNENKNKNKCCSTCFQCICILLIFTISFIIAVGLLAFGSWSYYQFHDD